jgi:flagellar hook protein FlgE
MEIAAAAALSGLQQAQTRLNAVASQIANPSDTPADSVDLSTQAVALIQSRNDFAANIAVLKTVDEMQKTVFDLTG